MGLPSPPRFKQSLHLIVNKRIRFGTFLQDEGRSIKEYCHVTHSVYPAKENLH